MPVDMTTPPAAKPAVGDGNQPTIRPTATQPAAQPAAVARPAAKPTAAATGRTAANPAAPGISSRSRTSRSSAGNTLADLRRLRFRLRRFLGFSEKPYKITPALGGIFLLTAASLGLTLAGWLMVRLLPNRQLITSMVEELPGGFAGFISLLGMLPELLETASSATVFTGALVTQEAYIILYACGGVSVFCFLLLLTVFVRKL